VIKAKPILTGEEVRAIRQKLGWTQEQLASALDFHGPLRRQSISRIETGAWVIDFLRANLLLAISIGYEVQGVPEAKRITPRQAEALWAARETGKATNLAMRVRGGARRSLYILRDAGYLGPDFTITKPGLVVLAAYEKDLKRPLTPLLRIDVLRKTGRAK
jgi:transcriptional regulator with XRE-family HTH domain